MAVELDTSSRREELRGKIMLAGASLRKKRRVKVALRWRAPLTYNEAAAYGDRTHDHTLTERMLYQLR